MSTVSDHVAAARSYAHYALTLIRAGHPQRAQFWRGMAADCMRDARIAAGTFCCTCDDCGARVKTDTPPAVGQSVLCEACWSQLGDIHDAIHF